MRMPIICTSVALAISALCHGQGASSDYRRASAIDTLYRDKVFNNPAEFHWLKGSDKLWYLNKGRGGKEFILVDVKKKRQLPAFDHKRLAGVLTQKSGKKVDAAKLPFSAIEISEDQKSITFQVDSARWRCDLSSYACSVIEIIKKHVPDDGYWGNDFDETDNKPVPSPDSSWVAFIKNYNVFIRSRSKKGEFQLSYDGAAGDFYSSYMQWSPDSKRLMAYKVRPGEKHLIYFVESTPKDQLQPKLCTREYHKAGDVLPHKQPQLFSIAGKKHIALRDELFDRQFSLDNIAWRNDSRAITFEYNERGHQQYKVIEADTSGRIRVLVEEHSDTFIDYSSKTFRYDVADGKEILWTSERDGWNHLYRYDGVTGKVINQVTKGEWVVRGVEYVDEKKQQVVFSASGMDQGVDPYLLQYCRINFDGSELVRLTQGDVYHSATFSPDYNYFVDQYSRIDLPAVTRLSSAVDGKEILPLQQADIKDLQKAGWKAPEVFSAKGRDGVTDIWGMIIRPSNFDAAKKYPVIEMIYAGPHDFYVPKRFSPQYRGLYMLAELGFIVVQVDGMGTSWRSKAFHDVCWKNLKDAGFPDRIAWMKAAAVKYSYLDISRVGVFGGSAGGQNAAAAVLFHPEFYKAAVASCGCHDNRMDKLWWNEQWMGYPVDQAYAESSNVVNAYRMEGNLMLILGELDDNVDPASTMQFADALIKAKKDFELIVIPGMGHSGGGEFGERKRRDFFVKHLLGVDPPSWSESYGSPGKNAQPGGGK